MAEWSPSEDTLMRDLAREGYSARSVSLRLKGRTRNSVIGRAFRIGVQFKGLVVLSPEQVTRRKQQCIRNANARQKAPKAPRVPRAPPGLRLGPGYSATLKPPVIVPVDVWAPLEGLTHRPWTSRRLAECKWPLDVGDEVHSCCRPASRSGYCDTHAAIAFRTDAAMKPKDYARSLRRYVA